MLYNLYLILKGAVEGKILLQTYKSGEECKEVVLGMISTFPETLKSTQEIWLACEKVVSLGL